MNCFKCKKKYFFGAKDKDNFTEMLIKLKIL